MSQRRRYTPEQKAYVRQHYHQFSNAELATHLHIDHPRKVLELARRLGIKWRAENGAPQWRERSPQASAPKRSIWLY
jgi:hypothetical protein